VSQSVPPDFSRCLLSGNWVNFGLLLVPPVPGQFF